MSNNKKTEERYSQKDLDEFDALIDDKLAIANEQLQFYRTQIAELSEKGEEKVNEITDSSPTFELDRLSELALRQEKLIKHLENAKLRIKNKVYGICRETGKLISKERLRAVPHATLSVHAKEKRNRR